MPSVYPSTKPGELHEGDAADLVLDEAIEAAHVIRSLDVDQVLSAGTLNMKRGAAREEFEATLAWLNKALEAL